MGSAERSARTWDLIKRITEALGETEWTPPLREEVLKKQAKHLDRDDGRGNCKKPKHI